MIDNTNRRSKLSAPDVMREATRVPPQLRHKKIKNISTSRFGKSGAIHFGRQDFTKLVTKKMKGLGGKRKKKGTAEGEEGGQQGENGTASANGDRQNKKARKETTSDDI